MPKQLNYNVRMYSADGKVQNGSTCYGLRRAVALLSDVTGQQWPYQVINRALRAGAGSLWACAWVSAQGVRVVSIEAADTLASSILNYRPGDPGRLCDCCSGVVPPSV